jgi:hypothetical protein
MTAPFTINFTYTTNSIDCTETVNSFAFIYRCLQTGIAPVDSGRITFGSEILSVTPYEVTFGASYSYLSDFGVSTYAQDRGYLIPIGNYNYLAQFLPVGDQSNGAIVALGLGQGPQSSFHFDPAALVNVNVSAVARAGALGGSLLITLTGDYTVDRAPTGFSTLTVGSVVRYTRVLELRSPTPLFPLGHGMTFTTAA